MKTIIKVAIDQHRNALRSVSRQRNTLEEIARCFTTALKNNGKILLCGNGGSCADAQHLAAELVGRFKKNRLPLPALALSTNTSILTAVGNDYGYATIFSRQVTALAKSEDVVVGISTSGNSQNIINAIKEAKKIGAKTVALLGKDGGKLKRLADIALVIEINDIPRIQEMHILAGHIICEIVEEAFFGKGKVVNFIKKNYR